MSSGTPKFPDAFRVGMQKHDQSIAKLMRQGLSPRQQELNRSWSYYCTQQYDMCKVSWDGREVLDPMEHETISRQGVVPPGFYNAAAFDEIPLEFRKPRAAFHLARVVVNRFTGLLFSQRMHPKLAVDGDTDATTFLESLAKTSRLWNRFAHARKFGGGMGSVGVTFRFKNGLPIIEIHDPRWCEPVFLDRTTGELEAMEIRYMYPDEIRGDDGVIREVWFWYRRTITDESDTLYVPALVEEGEEPDWVIQEMVEHHLGEFPGVWIRNTETDQVDGEPDCHGMFDNSDEIDMLYSQASQGALENGDPTLHIADDQDLADTLRKGSRNSIKTSANGKVAYVEIDGAGVDTLLKVAKEHKDNALTVLQVVLDTDDEKGGAMTAFEIERRYSSMHDRGDLFREQYGEMGVKPIVEKMCRAIVKLSKGLAVAGEGVVQASFSIPGNIESIAQRDMANPIGIDIKWPPWVKRGPSDALSASQAVQAARTAQAIDVDSSVTYLAPYFEIEDTAAALSRVNTEAKQAQDALTSGILAAGQAPPGHPGGDHPPPPPHPPGAGVGGSEWAHKTNTTPTLGAPPAPPHDPNAPR